MAKTLTIIKERITPETAAAMLLTNIDRNRSISVSRVRMYEHDMLTGKWQDNGETIKIDTEGRLIDGQHRLKAIVSSGCTQWLWVARGVDNSAFETVDTGFVRTPRQLFALSGDPLKCQRSASAVAGYAFRALMSVYKATPSQMSEFVEANRETLEWMYGNVKSAGNMAACYLVTAIAMHLYGVADKDINGFIDGATKSDFDSTKPAHSFRHCVAAEQVRKTQHTITLAGLQDLTRCAYSYANNLQRLSRVEDAYPMHMDSKYKIVKGNAHES